MKGHDRREDRDRFRGAAPVLRPAKGETFERRKERLIGELLPRLRLDLAQEPPRSLAALFPKPVKEVWLEVGFGSGEHLLWQAERHEDVGFIGCEPFINGMASLLGRCRDKRHRDDPRA